MSRWAGPIIDVLLDYVGNVQLCSRLKEHIDSFEDWAIIKEKAGRAVAAAAGLASIPQGLRLQAVWPMPVQAVPGPALQCLLKVLVAPGVIDKGIQPQRDHIIWAKVT